jgi:TolB protein
MRRRVSAGIVVIAGAAVFGTAAGAAAPHRNGLIVYQAQVGRHVQLFTIASDGTGVYQLTHLKESDAVWPSWSPDGKKIAFERDTFDGASVVTVNADGTRMRSLTGKGINAAATWSPDGKRLTGGTYIPGVAATLWVMRATGGPRHEIAREKLPKSDACNCIGLGSSVFSPDGKRIAFEWVTGWRRAAIFTVGADGRGLHRVTPWLPGIAPKIDWSPTNRILYSSPSYEPGEPGPSSNIYSIRPDGTGLRQLTHDADGTTNNGFDSSSPDGTKLVYVSNRAGASYTLWTMNADGSHPTRLTKTEGHFADWGTHP